MKKIAALWRGFAEKHQGLAQFIVFFLLSNGMTVLQMIMMPLCKALFGMTDLVNTNFQVFTIGQNRNGSPYYIFDYAVGALDTGGAAVPSFASPMCCAAQRTA